VSAGLFLVTVTMVVLIGATILVFGRARRSTRGADSPASRAETQRYLAENWTMVEQTARATGMSEEEIARVRANVLGASD
jgi:hypothetical protein